MKLFEYEAVVNVQTVMREIESSDFLNPKQGYFNTAVEVCLGRNETSYPTDRGKARHSKH